VDAARAADRNFKRPPKARQGGARTLARRAPRGAEHAARAAQRSEAALHQYPEQVLSEVGKQIAAIPELAELGTLAR
jgi:hypothetical protein